MSLLRNRAVTGLVLAVAASGLSALPSQANPAGSGLVISEVYGAGGNSGATYNADFVELYNPTDAPISLSGLSIHYRSATGTSGGSPTALSGSVPPAKRWLIQMSATGANGNPLPAPDSVASPALSMAAAGGQVYLLNGTTPITTSGNMAGNAAIVDMGGFATATSFETAAGPTATATQSAHRTAAGADTDNNSSDFTLGAVTPQNCDCAPPPPPPGGITPIAEIQGTGTVSPKAGETVTTRGVVTAAYPGGGFNGFYLQTDGTGGGTDATPGASDALFVLGAAAAATVTQGELVEVTGVVSEFFGLTQIAAADAAAITRPAETPVGVTPLATAYPTSDADREAHEGELLAPTNTFTVTNTYSTNQYAEIGLATGTKPLIVPTEVADAQDTAAVNAVVADNAARAVTLDDGASINFLSSANGGANKNIALPWLSKENPIRVGARATLHAPVILDYRNSTWKFQPTSQITGSGAATATFTNTRENAPAAVPGNLHLATFNVLNYFNTTGVAFVAAGGSCTYYTDRAGNRVTNNSCTPDGPRGAAEDDDLERQQAKIVAAINGLGADIVSLEEIENSVKLIGETDRDDALSSLVTALNAAAGTTRWAFAPSPSAADLPELAEQDVIRTAFIYNPNTVSLVGASQVLVGSAPFHNAREPLAQAFKPKGTPDSRKFAVIVNHFKSKGSGVNDGTGQGNANPDRIAQAQALVTFANEFAASKNTDKVFLTGDFNAYSMEDPMQVLYDAGFAKVASDDPNEWSYSFGGQSGSLDHVLASPAAKAMVAGADIWSINSGESVAFEYSRHNYNATDFFEYNPFRASDHDPEIVGLNINTGAVEQVQILATNDFHGRILNNTSNGEAGAAVLAGAVKKLREQNPNTVFAAAGDLIGASTFESFIQQDKPTIDALNEAGLEVSAVGNHEFDAGYEDLINRVMAPYDAETNPYGGAEWQYIGANVRMKATGNPAVPASWIKDFGDVEVGFIGAVTEDLPSLVSPAGIEDIEVTDIVEAANTTADDLEAAGADVIVLLVHEGAATTSLASATNDSAFGQIVNGVDGDIDAIVSGHTHLAYNHAITVPEWVTEGRAVTTRPVVSAGQYGTFLNQLKYDVNADTGEVVGLSQAVLNLKSGQTPNYPVDANTKTIVDAAVAKANELGARKLGELSGGFKRAKLANGTTENRGGESTLGNLVAEVQRWATQGSTSGSAQIAFMNPGGLRADMVGNNAGGYPADLTYKQAAEVQPFANTLVNMQMTGADIKTVLEQQWQRDASGNVPSRPFLRLGASRGFTHTYDVLKPEGARVTGMWLNGVAIDPATTYSVTVNSFLASGGDNFRAFNNGANKRDTGKIDLQAMVDYMAAFAATSPLPISFEQQAVGVSFPADAPASYRPNRDDVVFNLSSLAFSNASDVKDEQVRVTLDGVELGTFAVNNTIGTDIRDEYGTAAVSVRIPSGTPSGDTALTVTGLTTGTSVPVHVQVAPPAATEVAATA
ncbi:ExeM/NucH family extracellular endonuclease, partial [Nocardioides sp.]|uniref:ExeM/NucH family extracellular endonuclease n=1 Tax=Nocardioides sp. TaxID=35761 RepID=UPI003564DA6E